MSCSQPEDFLRRLSSWLKDLAREVGRLRFKFATGPGAPSERIRKLVEDANNHLKHYLGDSRSDGQHVLNPTEAATSVAGKKGGLDPAIVEKLSLAVSVTKGRALCAIAICIARLLPVVCGQPVC